jgi:hypothetical protein
VLRPRSASLRPRVKLLWAVSVVSWFYGVLVRDSGPGCLSWAFGVEVEAMWTPVHTYLPNAIQCIIKLTSVHVVVKCEEEVSPGVAGRSDSSQL